MLTCQKIPFVHEVCAVIDVDNAVKNNKNKGEKPSLKIYHSIKEKLIEQGFSEEKIISICDPPLRYQIQEKEEFEALLSARVILIAPLGKKADEFILAYAQQEPFCFIVSNDAFQDYKDEINMKWIWNRRITFMIIHDKVILSPCIGKTEVSKLNKQMKKEKPSRKGVDTLEVLRRIKSKEGEFNFYNQ